MSTHLDSGNSSNLQGASITCAARSPHFSYQFSETDLSRVDSEGRWLQDTERTDCRRKSGKSKDGLSIYECNGHRFEASSSRPTPPN